jgi:membrane protein implicated in regulation of membrane protease activity
LRSFIDTPQDAEYTTTEPDMETFFLACFAIGLLFLIASLVLGHVPHLGGGHGHLGHGHIGSPDSDALPLLNGSSFVGGLTWFGAAGYVLTRLAGFSLPAALIGAIAIGALGWYLVARFLGLILKGEVEMDPADYRLEGTVGKVSIGIPVGGTGEILFEKAGTRRSEAARALDRTAIPKGAEVVITTYRDGFATVQPWGEYLAARDALTAPASAEKKTEA